MANKIFSANVFTQRNPPQRNHSKRNRWLLFSGRRALAISPATYREFPARAPKQTPLNSTDICLGKTTRTGRGSYLTLRIMQMEDGVCQAHLDNGQIAHLCVLAYNIGFMTFLVGGDGSGLAAFSSLFPLLYNPVATSILDIPCAIFIGKVQKHQKT